ncbi:hypothetical protein [Deinococcus gobiensis]|uniref:Uncharacterized protein n=1 Tax=Deinococcus gobiensis (strain DSM 21396 / JCM 16679 / CGMCC 1.7299 / I-0) TaxID=745776 RepID=H8H3Q5_DEIGI|nr:hypothetical protein [Deinococcus gobiensis]AFD28152.1 hypothetical protein DGo_PE0008 [Deinococcus gobiensis I-0]
MNVAIFPFRRNFTQVSQTRSNLAIKVYKIRAVSLFRKGLFGVAA